MSNTLVGLNRKIQSAQDLHSVVRTMKAVSASSIGQYEKSVLALGEYYRTVELGLGACFRSGQLTIPIHIAKSKPYAGRIRAVIFGSDQGLVGQFNEVVADFAIHTLAALPEDPLIWAVGERVHAGLIDRNLKVEGVFPVPTTVKGISSLVGRIQLETENARAQEENAQLYLFHNKPKSGDVYLPVSQRLLPLDEVWLQSLAKIPWPTKLPPQIMAESPAMVRALIREYLFISMYRCCAESLASENGARLAAMERADKNIRDLLEEFNAAYHRLRQDSIDEELFDVVSGYESNTNQT